MELDRQVYLPCNVHAFAMRCVSTRQPCLSNMDTMTICQHYKARGILDFNKSPGRPPKLNKLAEDQLIHAIKRNPKGSFDEFGEIVHISRSAVKWIAHKHNFHSRLCRKKLFISEANRKKRMIWVMENERMDWDRIIWTGEAAFKIGEVGRQRCIRQPGTKYEFQHLQIKFQPGNPIHIWGCIMKGQKFPLVKFELAKACTVNKQRVAAQTITSEVYAQQILGGPLLNNSNHASHMGIAPLVVGDGASVHFKGMAGRLWEILPIVNQTHPPSSPNLNAIENCWVWNKGKLRQSGRHATSQEGLWEDMQRLWDELPQEIIDKWVDTMEERRIAVKEADGYQSGW